MVISPNEIVVHPNEIVIHPNEIVINPNEIAINPNKIVVRRNEIVVRPNFTYTSQQYIMILLMKHFIIIFVYLLLKQHCSIAKCSLCGEE